MAAFATPAELASWLQVATVDTATATLALNVASAKIRKSVHWSIDQEVATVATLDGSGDRDLWLPTLKLTAVTSVVEESVTLTVVTGFDWTSYGRLIRIHRNWSCKPRSVVVTYTHGFVTVPDDVKGVCLSLASRVYDNPTSVRSHQVDDFLESFAADSGPALTTQELKELAPYRLSVLG